MERLQLQLRNISGALGISGSGVEAELEAVRTLLVQNRFASALATRHTLKNRLRSSKVFKHHVDDASTLARDVRRVCNFQRDDAPHRDVRHLTLQFALKAKTTGPPEIRFAARSCSLLSEASCLMFQCVDILEKWQSTLAATGVAGGAETMAAVRELTGILTSNDMEVLLLAHDSIVSYVDGLQRKQSPASSPPSGPPSPTASWKDSRIVDNIKIIRIEKTNEPLGATVRNDGDAVIIGNDLM